MLTLGAAFLIIGFWRGQNAREWVKREQGLGLDKQNVLIQGNVANIRKNENFYVAVLEDCVILEEGEKDQRDQTEQKNMVSGHIQIKKIQVYLEQNGEMPFPGDRLLVKGKAGLFGEARNPGEFDYRLYYQAQGMNYRVFAASWKKTGEKKGHLWKIPARISAYGGKVLDAVACPKDAGIFRAAILGDKSGLDGDIRALYQKNGIAHLLAISGLHLSLAGGVVYGLLRRLGAGYGKAGLMGGGLLALYVVITGSSPSVVRAWIMAVCGYFAACMGRTYDLLSALGLSAFLILWDEPFWLCQAGVQLSFGAVAGIGIVSEWQPDSQETRKGVFWSKFLETLAVSLGMQFITLPVVLYHFFQVPVYGIFLNLLVVPLMGIVVASGCGGILLGSFSLSAGRFAAGCGHMILRFYEFLCRVWEAFPGSILLLGRPALWQAGLYFGALAVSGGMWKKRRRFAILFLTLAPLLLLPLPPNGMEVSFLDVGQGDGICIRTGEGTILVDGGSTDQKQIGKNRLEPFLKSKAVSQVDYAVVSHGDQDHISGLVYLLEESDIRIMNLVLPAAGRGGEIYEKLGEAAIRQGGKVHWMQRGGQLKMGRLEMVCLYPRENSSEQTGTWEKEDRNEHSLVFRADYGNFHMLLTGDMSGKGERELLELETAEREERESREEPGLKEVQVLKVAHHGSSYSTTKEWLDTLSPVWAVVSYGKGNRYGHPGEEVLKNLDEKNVEVFQTGESGAVWLRTDGRRIWWKCNGSRGI